MGAARAAGVLAEPLSREGLSGAQAVPGPVPMAHVRGAMLVGLSMLVLALAAIPAVHADLATEPCPAEAAVLASEGAASQARARYENDVGFVGVVALVGVDGLVAVFDLDARGGSPLPAPSTLPDGTVVHVDATRFQTLLEPLPAEGEPAVVPTPCDNHIGPGAHITTPIGGCTANVAFTDQNGRYYLSTAGHCIAVGQRMSIVGLGPVGTAVYRINGGIGQDFALVLLDAGLVPDPAICHWGGPTGVAAGNQAGLVRLFGHGVIWGQNDLTRPRTALSLITDAGADSFEANGLVSSGDSGSPARLDNGEHLGVITHVNLPLILFAQSAPTFWGTQLHHAIDLAEAGTGLDLTLMTAPVAA